MEVEKMAVVVGQRYAYRERVRAYGEPVCHVEATREGPPRSNKVRVRWLDGEYEGLEQWLPTIRLLAPWEDADFLLEDERRMLDAVEASESLCDDITREAVSEVLGIMSRHSDPSEEAILGFKAIESCLLVVESLDAATHRLDLGKEELLAEPRAFVDRFGWYKATFQTAVKVARHCCQRFPQTILASMHKDEEALRQELVTGTRPIERPWWVDSTPYREYAEDRLEELEPVHVLIRQWCGQKATEEFDQILALR